MLFIPPVLIIPLTPTPSPKFYVFHLNSTHRICTRCGIYVRRLVWMLNGEWKFAFFHAHHSLNYSFKWFLCSLRHGMGMVNGTESHNLYSRTHFIKRVVRASCAQLDLIRPFSYHTSVESELERRKLQVLQVQHWNPIYSNYLFMFKTVSTAKVGLFYPDMLSPNFQVLILEHVRGYMASKISSWQRH
jgi:hypothetical protein